jgi:hypothetical protein
LSQSFLDKPDDVMVLSGLLDVFRILQKIYAQENHKDKCLAEAQRYFTTVSKIEKDTQKLLSMELTVLLIGISVLRL